MLVHLEGRAGDSWDVVEKDSPLRCVGRRVREEVVEKDVRELEP